MSVTLFLAIRSIPNGHDRAATCSSSSFGIFFLSRGMTVPPPPRDLPSHNHMPTPPCGRRALPHTSSPRRPVLPSTSCHRRAGRRHPSKPPNLQQLRRPPHPDPHSSSFRLTPVGSCPSTNRARRVRRSLLALLTPSPHSASLEAECKQTSKKCDHMVARDASSLVRDLKNKLFQPAFNSHANAKMIKRGRSRASRTRPPASLPATARVPLLHSALQGQTAGAMRYYKGKRSSKHITHTAPCMHACTSSERVITKQATVCMRAHHEQEV